MYLRHISRRSRSFTNGSRLAQTGAVLSGVTVESASSVLIEKVRTAVTDGRLSGRAS